MVEDCSHPDNGALKESSLNGTSLSESEILKDEDPQKMMDRSDKIMT
jgi:hypothetical protein